MKFTISSEEERAKEFEDAARHHLREKAYDEAIVAYGEAIEIYKTIGWDGQVGILMKEIQRIVTMKKFFEDASSNEQQNSEDRVRQDQEKKANSLLKMAQDAYAQKRLEVSQDLYQQALGIFEEYHFDYQVQKINQELQKIESRMQGSAGKGQAFTSEQRTQHLPEEKGIGEQKQKLQAAIRAREQQSGIRLKKVKSRKIDLPLTPEAGEVPTTEAHLTAIGGPQRTQIERKREIEEKRRREKKSEEQAFSILDQAKRNADKNEFDMARELYEKAITFLDQINWKDQIKIVKQEIVDLKEREAKFQKRKLLEQERTETQERQFETRLRQLQIKNEIEDKKRVKVHQQLEENQRQIQEEGYRLREDEMRQKQERLVHLEEEKRENKSPEWVKKAQLADMTLQKAQKLATAGKIAQALQRYKYLLELYRDLEYEPARIDEITLKISELEVN